MDYVRVISDKMATTLKKTMLHACPVQVVLLNLFARPRLRIVEKDVALDGFLLCLMERYEGVEKS